MHKHSSPRPVTKAEYVRETLASCRHGQCCQDRSMLDAAYARYANDPNAPWKQAAEEAARRQRAAPTVTAIGTVADGHGNSRLLVLAASTTLNKPSQPFSAIAPASCLHSSIVSLRANHADSELRRRYAPNLAHPRRRNSGWIHAGAWRQALRWAVWSGQEIRFRGRSAATDSRRCEAM